MNYQCPSYANLGAIGAPMNPLFVDNAIAFGPTRVMAAPHAGYAYAPTYGLAGFREYLDVFTAPAFLFPE
jgi:hypothetical protein